MSARTLGPSYQKQTRPYLETRLARLRDCRGHGEQGLDNEITTLCQSLTVIDALTAENAALRDALAGLFEHCTMIHKQWGDGDNTKQADAAIEAARSALAQGKGRE